MKTTTTLINQMKKDKTMVDAFSILYNQFLILINIYVPFGLKINFLSVLSLEKQKINGEQSTKQKQIIRFTCTAG
jgi:hypothetical protein